MRILVTNDDGISAPGLAAIVHVATQFGEVKVAAPDRERSACGHGMTLRDPLRLKSYRWSDRVRIFEWGAGPEHDCIESIEINGLPVDCVNLGLDILWPDGCDLILSGFNRGPNLGFDVTYSGTVAGAMEGCINGIRSIAISMACFVEEAPPHFETGIHWLKNSMDAMLSVELQPLCFLNVNVPAVAIAELQGTRVTKMGQRIYEDRVEERADPTGRPYYWQGGTTVMQGVEPGSDVQAIRDLYASITPVSVDWTNRAMMPIVEKSLAIHSKN